MKKQIDFEEAEDKIKNASLSIMGYSITPTQIGIGFTILSSILGTLYAGFTMYQRLENISAFVDDIDSYNQKMEIIDGKVKSIDANLYAIKEDLKGDIRRIADVTDDIERDTKDDLRSFRKDIKEVEDRLNDRMQKFLDNPLSGNK